MACRWEHLLGAMKVMPHSRIKAVWQCDKCLAGQPHVWTAHPTNRTRSDTQCLYCCNRLVCSHNSLAIVAPDAVLWYWNHSKNEKAPEQVLAGSNFSTEWTCPTCKWEWRARIACVVNAQPGCPKCTLEPRVLPWQPKLAQAQPAELAEWDYEHNDAKSLYPSDITLGSNKQAHWICSCCPRGQPHPWKATPNSRVRGGTGCPIFAGQQACVCNSLETLFPAVAVEWDLEKSGFAPSEIRAHSHMRV